MSVYNTWYTYNNTIALEKCAGEHVKMCCTDPSGIIMEWQSENFTVLPKYHIDHQEVIDGQFNLSTFTPDDGEFTICLEFVMTEELNPLDLTLKCFAISRSELLQCYGVSVNCKNTIPTTDSEVATTDTKTESNTSPSIGSAAATDITNEVISGATNNRFLWICGFALAVVALCQLCKITRWHCYLQF